MAILLRCLAAAAVAAGAFGVHELLLEDKQVADQRGAKIFTVAFESEQVGGNRLTKVVVPADVPAKQRPLLIFLHGRGEDERSYLTETVFAALDRVGAKAPLIAFPESGDASYWHDREDGDWASYVSREVLPRVIRRFEIDPDRIAIGGISMGGYGAYNVARLSPGRFCAIGGHSPALWLDSGDTASGAFDNNDDFARNDVFTAANANPSPYADSGFWLDVGDEDPFASAVAEFARALETIPEAELTYKTRPGAHNNDYWDPHWYGYLRFYADALDDCGVTEPQQAGVDEVPAGRPKKP